MRFPAGAMQRQDRGIAFEDLCLALKDKNYLRLCLFVGIWGFLLNAAMPFYTVSSWISSGSASAPSSK